MKYVSSLALVVSLAVVSACGGTDSPSTPSGSGTQTFTAALRPSEEVPAVTGAESAGSGTATITLNVAKDSAGNVTSATATFAVNLSGFPATTPINMAHIHQAAAGQSGNVVVSTTLAPGEVTLNGGSGSFNRSGIAVTPEIASQLMTNPAGFYFNVHSTLNPSGAARGQLVRVQ
jgi:CHRD domain-containing protein